MEYEAWIFAYFGAQQCDQIAVNLECIERPIAGFEQQAGECSTAWPNFHEAIVRTGPDRSDDVFQDRGVVQEMLAKPLASAGEGRVLPRAPAMGSPACGERVARDGHPGLARSRDSGAQWPAGFGGSRDGIWCVGQSYSLAASSMASPMAEPRLLGSARPVPARSSAVPWSTDVRSIGSPRVMLTAVSKPACLITGRPWS